MKHIKKECWFLSDCLFLVGCAPDQESTKQTTKWTAKETKAKSEASYRHQSNDFTAVEKQAPTKNDELIANQLTFDSHEYTLQGSGYRGATQTTFGTTPPAKYTPEEKKEKCFGPINRLWD